MRIALPPQPVVHLGAPLRRNESAWPAVAGPPTRERARPGAADGTIAPRQCGRCRAMFPGDPTLDPFALPEWWLCPPCRLALLGQEPRGPCTLAGTARGFQRAR
jgi:hypothetical protein